MSQYQIDEGKRVEVSRQIATNKGVIKIQDWKNGEKLPLRPPTHSMSGYDTGMGQRVGQNCIGSERGLQQQSSKQQEDVENSPFFFVPYQAYASMCVQC